MSKVFPSINHPFLSSAIIIFRKIMTWYLEYLDLEVWKTILFGYTFPTKDVDGGKIRKNLEEYNEENRKF